MAAFNLKRQEAWQAMTRQEKFMAMGLTKRKRTPALTPEEKKEKQREYQRQYYAANKEKRAASNQERGVRARQA